MSRLDWLREHRELEYLRSVGRFSRRRRKHLNKTDFAKARERIRERAKKLDEVPK